MSSRFRHNSAPSEDALDNNNRHMSKSPSSHGAGGFNLMPPPHMSLSNSQGYGSGFAPPPSHTNMYQNFSLQMNDPQRSPHAVNPPHFKYAMNFKENNQNLDVSPDDVKITMPQSSFETSQTNTATVTRGLQYQSGNPRDAMLSAINYSDQEMLPEPGFDAAVTSSLPQLDPDGILGTISNVNELRMPENPATDGFDLFEEAPDNFMETQQDLTMSPHGYPDAGPRFAMHDSDSKSGDGSSQAQEPLNMAPKPRGKGRPRSSGSPGRMTAQCQQCGKTFSNSSALAKHKLTHSDERKYVCKLCSKAFKRQDHLNGHMMTHRSKKPYECKFDGCDKSYCDARSLRRHYENHHNQSAEQANEVVNAAKSMPPPPIPPSQYSGQNGDGAGHYPPDAGGGRIQYAPPPAYNASPHTSPSFNTGGGNQQGQSYFQFDAAPYHSSQDSQSSWQHQQPQQDSQGALYRMNQYVNNQQIAVGHSPRSGETSPGYQQQFSPISPASGAHPTSPMQQHPSQRAPWMAPHYQQSLQPKPVECTICQRKFKNIPALNGHMRLHGGYFKKDLPPIKTDDDPSEEKQQTESSHPSHQPQPELSQYAASHTQLQAALKQKFRANSDEPSQEMINSIATSLAAMSQGQGLPSHQFNSFQPSNFVAQNHMSASQLMSKPPTLSDVPMSLDLSLDDSHHSEVAKLSDLPLAGLEKEKPSIDKILQVRENEISDVISTGLAKSSPAPSSFSFTPISLPSSTSSSRVSNGAPRYAPVPRGGKPANYWKKEKYNPDYKKMQAEQAFSFSKEDTQRSRQLLQKDLLENPKPSVPVSSPVTPGERKRHVSADPDKFTSPRSSLTSPGTLSNFLNENRDPMHPGRRRRDSEKYLRSPRYERSSSIDGFVRPRSSADGIFREPYRPHSRSDDPYSRSDGAVGFRSGFSGRGRKKHRPEPLIIPPHMNNCGFQSRLRSPRLWEGEKRNVTPPPYTPPPMLSPVRSGSGLFWSLHPMKPITPGSAPHTPRMSLSRRNSLASSMTEKILQEVKEVAEPQIEEEEEGEGPPTMVEEPPPETDVQPHVNIGPQYQAELPVFNENKSCAFHDVSLADMVSEPETFKELTESDVQYFQDFACCAAVRHNGMNKEYALHLLFKHKGNITEALLDLMNTEPQVTKQASARTYKYNETATWTTAEIEAYNAAVIKHDKDFFKIGREVEKSTKDCVEFYYLWKKCCPDEYKRSRILRRRREHDELYNLRQRQDPPVLAKEDDSDSDSDSSKSDDDSANNSDASSTTGSITANTYPCEFPLCAATFSTRQALAAHSRVHSRVEEPPPRPQPAPEVKKVERRGRPPGSTNKHHAPAKPLISDATEFPCKLCDKVFLKVKSRNAHMKSHRQREEKERQERLKQQNLAEAMGVNLKKEIL